MFRDYGTVTVGNIDEICTRMRKMLGGRKYTVVHVYEYKQFTPEVRLHQQLEGSVSHKPIGDFSHISVHHHNDSHAQLIICDTYGVGGLSTTQTEDKYDPDFNAPYLSFEFNQIHITQRAPNGLLFYTIYAVE